MNIKYAITVSIKLLFWAFLVLVSPDVYASGLDVPHNTVNSISCGNCHDIFAYNQPNLMPPWTVHAPQDIDDTQLNTLCRGCHNDIPVPYVKTHSSLQTGTKYGNWTVECSVCHDPHAQEQNNLNGSTYGKLIRKQISLNRITGTIPQKIGSKTVKFLGQTGANSFADGDAVYDGICEVCHTKTSHHRNNGTAVNQSHNDGTRCTICHSHVNGFAGFDHTAAGVVVPVSPCMDCHGALGSDLIAGVHGNQCGLCHVDPLGAGPLVEPYETNHPHGGACSDCHGPFSTIHSHSDHNAASQSGIVEIFSSDGHDSSFDEFMVQVDCITCHTTNLQAAHGNDCSTCHPTPYNTLGTWNRTCQQGGCHTVFHADSTTAHDPFSATNDSGNDCLRCHNDGSWIVDQNHCLNCHATAGNATVPITTSNAQPSYTGLARIAFSINVGGRIGLGRTFYKLDGATAIGGSQVVVSTPGSHTLEFWSASQAGSVESPPKSVSFTINEDITPPTTTSNALAGTTYYQGAVITLTATDASTQGVKTTYFSYNGGPTQTGTSVVFPATSGTIAYTLLFWSEDWAGNIESQHSVSFSITSGGGTLRLVWGDSDVGGSPCTGNPDAEASWTISRGGTTVATGSGGCPSWSGVDDVYVPISPTKYVATIDWWNTDGYWDQTYIPNIEVTTPNQIIRLSY
jgi:hypothetical protein